MISKSLEETKKLAQEFLKKISVLPKDKKYQATVVGLFGDLGSGKTIFTQALALYLGITEDITSPTFVIEKRYEINQGQAFGVPKAWPWSKLIHIDAYRLEGGKEILNLNFSEDLNNSDNLILIEWPEKVTDALPADLLKVNFKFISETEREIDML